MHTQPNGHYILQIAKVLGLAMSSLLLSFLLISNVSASPVDTFQFCLLYTSDAADE